MKARIPSSQERKLLLYGLTPEQTNKMEMLAQSLFMEACPLEEESLDRQVGALAGFPGFDRDWRAKERPALPQEACMVMAGLSSKELDGLLAGMKREGIIIPLKAVVTAANQSWSLARLMAELDKERAALQHRAPGR